ncbi:MAG: hypothetical protein HY22_06980 [[Candidatus Thermochlorobacteriaceae] bacterium GBChlB]|nr:MAG: hypothetical protein HY22_06980 [[Candidatus Thermochlorobacteriaceae] bacterium GBChlB]
MLLTFAAPFILNPLFLLQLASLFFCADRAAVGIVVLFYAPATTGLFTMPRPIAPRVHFSKADWRCADFSLWNHVSVSFAGAVINT